MLDADEVYLQLVVSVCDEVLIVRREDDLLELLVGELELELPNSVRNGSGDAEGAELGHGPDPRHDHAFVLVIVQHHLNQKYRFQVNVLESL